MTDTANLFVVDAFTAAPFRGNPAGVVLLDQPRDEGWLQSLAAELRHSETAYVGPLENGKRNLRWFTPTTEVDLCGHATLATAHILGEDSVFATRSGELRTKIDQSGWITMDFPADPTTSVEILDDLYNGLGRPSIVAVERGVSDILVEVSSEEDVRDLTPNFDALTRVSTRGIIVTAQGSDTADIVSRCFLPAVGVPEDPVTGSAHCTLASYWCPKLGEDTLHAVQVSERGGSLRITLKSDERVELAGQAITVFEGHIRV